MSTHYVSTTSGSASPIPAATTMELFLGRGNSGATDGFVASIVHADRCGTTYALHCTAGSYEDYGIVSGFCEEDFTLTGTYSPGSYSQYTVGVLNNGGAGEVTMTIDQSCRLDGTSTAVCTWNETVGVSGKTTAVGRVSTYTGTNVLFAQVPITAGVQKLSDVAACPSTSSGLAPAATGISRVYKVVVIPGAAAILAALLA